jgi:cell cycle arrest protein BUB3
MSDFELFDNPSDGISSVNFHPENSDHLLASSWDGNVYLYSLSSNRTRAKLGTGAALLDSCFSGRNPSMTAFAGGLKGILWRFDLHGYRTEQIGSHEAAIKSVRYCVETNRIFSGSWDSTVRVWDDKVKSEVTQIAKIELPDKVYSMDLQKNILIIAMANRHVYLYDTRRLDAPMQRRESSLKYQTRCIRLFPDSTGFAISSIEGRVGVEYVDASEAIQAKKYAFKCHREPAAGPTPADPPCELVYPVNALAFHAGFGTFATGGADGVVCMWDAVNKKRVKQLSPKYPSSISALDFSNDGRYLAVASSYSFEEGEREYVFYHILIPNL